MRSRRLVRAAARLALLAGLPGITGLADAQISAPTVTLGPGAQQEALPAVAPGDSQFDSVADVAIEARTGWPKVLTKGYFPILVDLQNGADEERVVDLEVRRSSAGWARYTTLRTVALAPGERRSVELIVPAFEVENGWSWGGVASRSANLVAEVAGTNDRFSASFNLQGRSDPVWSIVVTGERLPSEPELQSLVAVLSSGGQDVQVSAVATTDLPARFEPYSSLAAVVVDVRGGLPDEDVLEPILTWVRLGGAIAFVGPDVDEKLQSLALVRPWIEERFERPALGPTAWQMGLGTVMAFGSTMISHSAEGRAARWVLERLPPLEPVKLDVRWNGSLMPTIPDLGDLPFRGFGVLMVLFAILVGPVNFITLKRLGKNALLLVTIPLVAFVTSVGILAYGTMHQGIDVKRAEVSLTLLDQRNRRSSTIASRQIFAGLATRGGLRPGPGTACYPLQNMRESRSRTEYTTAMGAELSLTGDFLPPRVPMRYVIAGDRPARLRVGVERDGDGFRVANELTREIHELVLATPDGTWFRSRASCAPGAKATLVPGEERDEAALLNAAVDRGLWPEGALLPAGSYLALVAEDPFVDDCGIESVEYAGWHLIVGVLEDEVWQ